MASPSDKFPHRRRLRDLVLSSIETARSQIPGAGDYARKQLERHIVDMQKMIDIIDTMKEEYDPDPE